MSHKAIERYSKILKVRFENGYFYGVYTYSFSGFSISCFPILFPQSDRREIPFFRSLNFEPPLKFPKIAHFNQKNRENKQFVTKIYIFDKETRYVSFDLYQ